MIITRIFDVLEKYREYDKPDALCGKNNAEWVKYSSKQYLENVENVSYGLMALGIQKEDKIAIISPNCPEINFVDMGAQQIGAIVISIYPNITESEYQHILSHSESRYIFIYGKSIYDKIKKLITDIPTIKGVFSFEPVEGINPFSELIELGLNNRKLEKLKEIKSEITQDDIATIIYTSGTTGIPKGAMLSHHNLVSNFLTCAPLSLQNEKSRIISFLPLCHIYERMLNYAFQSLACSMYYVSNLGTIIDCIQEIKPHCFCSVPRLLEKVYDRIIFKGRNLDPIRKAIFFWAVRLADKYTDDYSNSKWYYFKLKIADFLIYNKWRAAFGNNIIAIVSGGASLQLRIARIFNAAKIPILEGYGLTETSPVIAVNNFNPGSMCFGTVGPILEGVEVKFAKDDEILSKGPHIMKGYYKDHELTKQVIDADGWFHTGDLGYLHKGRFLKITGRKKSLFKTSMGKYVSPEHIENKLCESRFIENVMVIGENQKFVGALIVPDFQYLKNWANIKMFGYIDNHTAINTSVIKNRIQKEVDDYNKLFNPHEQIIRFELLPEEWSIETGEITPTLKIKRDFIGKKYKDKIEKLFK